MAMQQKSGFEKVRGSKAAMAAAAATGPARGISCYRVGKIATDAGQALCIVRVHVTRRHPVPGRVTQRQPRPVGLHGLAEHGHDLGRRALDGRPVGRCRIEELGMGADEGRTGQHEPRGQADGHPEPGQGSASGHAPESRV